MADLERRAVAYELRADAEARRLTGYAAVFNEDTRIADFTERVAPGAFTATLAAGADVLCLVDHNAEALLGRTKSGTLTLQQDQRGLGFMLQLPATTLAADILALAQRGDIGGASIGFHVERETWPAPDRRVLQAVELVEISIVRSFPAYSGTIVSVRSRPAAVPMSYARRKRFLATL